MSFKALEWVESVKGLHPVERVILYYLARRSNNKNQCWPSIRTIKDACEIARGSVYRALSRLEALNLLKIESRESKNGRTTSSLFTLKLNRLGGGSHQETVVSPDETGLSPDETLILESSSESSLNLKTASNQTVHAFDFSDWKVGIEEDSPTLSHPNLVQHLMGFPLTPEMKAMGITGVAFQSQAELEEFGPTLGIPVNLDDILQMHKKNLTPEKAILKAKKGKTSYTSMGLAGLWRDLNAYYNPGVFQKPLTMKEQGQLRHAAKLPDGIDIGWILNDVLSHWVYFGKFLKEQGLVQDFPDTPHIGFFLKHAAIAAEFGKKPITVHSSSGGPKPFDPNE